VTHFLVDANLPPLLARWLTQRGHPSRHVIDVLEGSASDADVWNHAAAHDMVIITKDEDFAIHRDLALQGPRSYGFDGETAPTRD